MIRILSTKTLAANQKQLLLDAGFAVEEADFIGISFKKADLDEVKDNLIFTSSNAVKAILSRETENLKGKPCFCVGDKTQMILERNGFKVIATADNALALSRIILEQHAGETFTFFSGNLRLPELPGALDKAGIIWNEKQVYETTETPSHIKSKADGILFFSPSGVESFLSQNTLTHETCFCIGNTTAKALQDITENIIIADKPGVEHIIHQCISYFHT